MWEKCEPGREYTPSEGCLRLRELCEAYTIPARKLGTTKLKVYRAPTSLKNLENPWKKWFIFKALKVLEFGQNWINKVLEKSLIWYGANFLKILYILFIILWEDHSSWGERKWDYLIKYILKKCCCWSWIAPHNAQGMSLLGVRRYFRYLGINMKFPSNCEWITEPVFHKCHISYFINSVSNSRKSLGLFNKCY